MLKKIVAGVLLLFLLSITGTFVLFQTKGDVLIEKFSAYIEETTGEPLSIVGVPNLSFFPSPSLELGQATWGRPDGRIFVSFSRATVSISAKALMTGKVRITGLHADELDVVLRMETPPKTRVDSPAGAALPQASNQGLDQSTTLLAHTSLSGSPQDLGQEIAHAFERVLDVLPNKLEVRQGRLRITLPDASVITLSELDLTSGNDRSARTVSAVASAMGEYMAGPGTPPFSFLGSSPTSSRTPGPLSGRLDLNFNAALSDSQLALDLTKATLQPKSGLSFTTPVSLSAKGDYTLTSGALKLHAWNAELPGLSVSATGSIESVPAMLTHPLRNGEGILGLKLNGSPRELWSALGKTWNTEYPKALNKANISASATLREGVVTVSALDGMVDTTPLNGHLRIGLGAQGSRLSLSGDIVVGALDLDALLPTPALSDSQPTGQSAPQHNATAAQQKKSVRTITALAWPDLNLGVRIKSLTFKGLTLSAVSARCEGTQGEYTINPLSFSIFDSPVTASLKASLIPKTFPPTPESYAMLSANISASGINLASAGRYFLHQDVLSGTGSLNATLSCLSHTPITTLSGKGSLSAEPLTIKKDLLPPNAGIGRQTPIEKLNMGQFDKALLTFVAEKGLITIKSASLTAPRLTLNGQGNINLPAQSLDLSGTLQIPGLAVLPVRLAGPLAAPRYSLNSRTTLDAVSQTLQEHGVDVQKEIERGLNSLFKKR